MTKRNSKSMSKQEQRADTAKATRKSASLFFAAAGAFGLLVASAIWLWPGVPANATEVTVYKSPTCGCCEKWIDHLEDNGFDVVSKDVRDLSAVKAAYAVAPRLASCHTALVDGYVVEGHVPAVDIKRLLAERPPVKGLAVPGMPMGSPGMEGPRNDPYDVVTFDGEGRTKVFARH